MFHIDHDRKEPMKKAILGLVIVLLLSACAAPVSLPTASPTQSPMTEAKMISPEEGKAMLDQKGATLVDVRTEAEYLEKRIPGALLLPVEDMTAKAAAMLPDKNTPVIVYCHSGRRSAIAAKTLIGMGYAQVYDMGGIQNWPYETTSGK
jgi:phage shock protein E